MIIHREEETRSGGRFRNAGMYLLPLDKDEEFDIAEFNQVGTHPKPRKTPAAKCGSCSADTLGFWVVIGRNGTVTQFERAGRLPDEPRAVAAAEKALSSWRFEPADIHGRPVSDWMIVKVPISH
jgi:hypothetical protein